MRVYLKQDVPKVGMQGEIVTVSDGLANNYLIPKKLVVPVTSDNEDFYKKRQRALENRTQVIASETSMLAEKIKALQLTIRKKMHDGDKLYGSISASDIAELLAEKGFKFSKSQILIDKSIKQKGSYPITVKLSTRLQPSFILKVMPEAE